MDKRLSIREVVLFGVLGALTFALQVAMAGLPNIEPVSLLVMLFAVTFGWKSLYPVYVFVVMEIFFYGFSTWNIYYFYVWTILAVAAIAMRNMEGAFGWAILSAVFGLAFGALCLPMHMILMGTAGGFGWWVSGIPMDLLHGIGNFVMTLVLFEPLRRVMERCLK